MTRPILIFCLLTISTFRLNAQTRYDIQFPIEGNLRELIVSVPTKQPPAEGYPVVFMLHGTSGEAMTYYNAKGWKELGQEENFVTVFPSSLSWCYVDDGIVKQITRFVCGGLLDSICPQEIPNLVDDVAFFRKIVDLMKDTISINEEKIFLNGFSNGSCMSHKVAMDAGDLFKVAAGSSSPLHQLDSLTPQKRIPFWYILGSKDDRFFSPNFPDELPFGGDSILAYHNKALTRALVCQGLTTNYEKFEAGFNKTYIWRECRPGEVCAPYLFSINKGQTHQFPNGMNFPFDAPRQFWNFFNNPPETIMTLQAENEVWASFVRIMPNPASENVLISIGLMPGQTWDLVVTDLHGKNIASFNRLSESEQEISVDQWAAGVYMINITQGKQNITKKMVKL